MSAYPVLEDFFCPVILVILKKRFSLNVTARDQSWVLGKVVVGKGPRTKLERSKVVLSYEAGTPHKQRFYKRVSAEG